MVTEYSKATLEFSFLPPSQNLSLLEMFLFHSSLGSILAYILPRFSFSPRGFPSSLTKKWKYVLTRWEDPPPYRHVSPLSQTPQVSYTMGIFHLCP